MNARYENERDLHQPIGQDREISLGTTTILGIFFALTLLCAVFFGIGYSLGRRSSPPITVPAAATTDSDSSIAKPASGSPADQTARKPDAGVQSAALPMDSPGNTAPQDTQQTPDPTPIKPAHNESARPFAKPAVVPVSAVTTSSGSSVVQVAAMSHQEDAAVVAADLKRRGYTVAIRRVPQDKLFHVQIGPFANKKEVDAMRQHLQADGYNSAIVK